MNYFRYIYVQPFIMQFTALLIILTSLATAQASAVLQRRDCFNDDSDSPRWNDSQQLAKYTASKICKREGVAGHYEPGQTKVHCQPAAKYNGFEIHIQYSVQFTGAVAHVGPLLGEDCVEKLLKEIHGCQSGGRHY